MSCQERLKASSVGTEYTPNIPILQKYWYHQLFWTNWYW